MSEGNWEEKAANWDRIAEAWHTYCFGGASAFDWDYDSRDLMEEMTGDRAFSWIHG